MGQPSEKAKTPEQHKAVRALGVAIWADKKLLFSQAWVEVAATGVRLFLTSAYLFVIAWRHPPNCRQNRKSDGSDFSKPPLFIGHSHDFSNAKPITMGKVPICYRLCVCASGSMMDVFSCRTLINISCLHLGQYNGNLSSTVSTYTFIRVFPPQAGQHIQ